MKDNTKETPIEIRQADYMFSKLVMTLFNRYKLEAGALQAVLPQLTEVFILTRLKPKRRLPEWTDEQYQNVLEHFERKLDSFQGNKRKTAVV